MQYLDLNLRPIKDVDPRDFSIVAMVDSQPRSGNASLPNDFVPHVVIDHHPIRNNTRKSAFTDIRSRYGATATILWEYLEHAGITPEMPVATALLYGIRSDTQDLGREATQADIDAAEKLHSLANKRILGQIQRGRVPGDYFQMLVDALREAVIYPNAIIASLGELHNADMLGEAADLFLRHELVGWTMAYGFYKNKALVSVRTIDGGLRAEDVVKKIISRIGTGGGHATSAGGQVPLKKKTATYRKELEKKFRDRFLRSIGSDNKKGVRLVKG
ncbi:MAG: DHH family phosphoesterase [Phycisphaerae bacterium]